MQRKTIIVLILAFTLNCAVARFNVNPDGWAKAPVAICDNNDFNCPYYSASLGSMNASDVTLFSQSYQENTNTTNASWSIYTRSVDTKTLDVISNASYSFNADSNSKIISGFAVAFEVAQDSNGVSQVFLSQTKLDGAIELPRVTITSNTNASFIPSLNGTIVTQKTIFVFSKVADQKINVTTVVLGESTIGKEFTLSTTFTGLTIEAAAGKALSSSQVLAGFIEGDDYKVSVIDSSSGIISISSVGNYSKAFECSPYVTDLKHFGVYCTLTTYDTVFVFVSTNTTNLTYLFSAAITTTKITNVMPYAGHLAFITENRSGFPIVVSSQIFDLDTFKIFKNKTDFMTYYSINTYVSHYRFSDGSVYSLIRSKFTTRVTIYVNVHIGLLFDPFAESRSLDSSDLSEFLALY